jgi:hypothetical protein
MVVFNILEVSIVGGLVGACTYVYAVDYVWNVMAHAQKLDLVFRRKGRVHLNRQGRQFSRLLAAEVCASAVVMLATPSSEVVWRVLPTHSIRHFSLHFPSRASPCAITFQLDSTNIDFTSDFVEFFEIWTIYFGYPLFCPEDGRS